MIELDLLDERPLLQLFFFLLLFVFNCATEDWLEEPAIVGLNLDDTLFLRLSPIYFLLCQTVLDLVYIIHEGLVGQLHLRSRSRSYRSTDQSLIVHRCLSTKFLFMLEILYLRRTISKPNYSFKYSSSQLSFFFSNSSYFFCFNWINFYSVYYYIYFYYYIFFSRYNNIFSL